MIITDGYPRFDKTDTNDKNKMKPAFEQMLSCIRQHSLTYNEAKAVFRALENAMPAIMVYPTSTTLTRPEFESILKRGGLDVQNIIIN